jgi:hypothetical protein
VQAELIKDKEAGGQAGVGLGFGAFYRAELPALAGRKAHRDLQECAFPLMLVQRHTHHP